MALKTLSSGLTLKIPQLGHSPWTDDFETEFAQKISEHDHTGAGKGLQITAGALASSAVTEAKIATGAVTTTKIGADAVTGAKIADDQIDSEHYVAGSIDTEHLSDDSVTGAKIGSLQESLDLDGVYFAGFKFSNSQSVAAAGSSAVDAGLISRGLALCTGADGTKGVKLPLAAQGYTVFVVNSANAVLKLYPNSADDWEGGGSSAKDVAAYQTALCIAIDSTSWIVIGA